MGFADELLKRSGENIADKESAEYIEEANLYINAIEDKLRRINITGKREINFSLTKSRGDNLQTIRIIDVPCDVKNIVYCGQCLYSHTTNLVDDEIIVTHELCRFDAAIFKHEKSKVMAECINKWAIEEGFRNVIVNTVYSYDKRDYRDKCSYVVDRNYSHIFIHIEW